MDTTSNHRQRDTSLAQKLALIFGVAFLGAGILGFIPGITTNYDELQFAGHESDAKLLGLFQVSVLHNIVHALFGIGILAARRHDTARTYLLGSGIVYAVLVLYGIVFGGQDETANFVPINDIDTWLLHLPLTAGLLLSWFLTRHEREPRATTTPA